MMSASLVFDKKPSGRLGLSLLIVVLGTAFAIGGGGSRFALANLAIQLSAFVALAASYDSALRFWRESSAWLRAAVIASLALPLIQIIPLPEAVWTALPSRDLVAQSLEMTGQPGGWMPLSLDPYRTLLAFSALVTPLAVLVSGWALSRHQLLTLGWVIVGLGAATVLLGLAQLGAPDAGATVFGSRWRGNVLLGTFANRNTTGLFLTFALGLAALLPAPRPHPAVLPIRLSLCILLVVAVLLTQSRTALVLTAIPLSLGALKEFSAIRKQRSASRGSVAIALGAATLVIIGTGALLVTAPGRVSDVLERFEAKDDPRRFIWDDATYTAGRYWPIGTGQGTFDEVFQVDESLENLTQRRAGRAHNDYIELAIESGMAGLVLAAAWLLLVGWMSWRARLSSLRWTAWGASGFLLCIALQSITDYPLRNQTILAFGGFALLLLARIATDAGIEKSRALQ